MKTISKIFIVLLATLLLSGFRWSLMFGELEWADIDQALDQDFPTVRQLSVEEVRSMLDSNQQFVLVDVREPAEYQVSHLPNALPADAFQPEKSEKDLLIVAYCSVGLRSAKYVQQLQQQGLQNVYNLRGSIFMWANKGYPLESDNGPVARVHPFNERWGKLLRPELRSEKNGDDVPARRP
ncbi:rhodanese-like domain-containing protein [Desulfopila aestuarii]|uniref:Rhodanese-related sulfurtransferase n=1 Tax=Desulfopila aestuarii DSM 18488 TaxID=1121416 RepID=A0A1M7Y4U6_9BACT|nr:rhodanese-like domain-containing protein [Desulfopila aestuarii]SHO47371.1 Rhodanese-related sulfurtransferase [Desulfopila aestuarii DSM 18488]